MNKHGGSRSKAGRKPLKDKKKAVTVYPLESQIDACGGLEASKEVALNAIVINSIKSEVKSDEIVKNAND